MIEQLQAIIPVFGTLGVIAWLVYERVTSGSDRLRTNIDQDYEKRIAQLEKREIEAKETERISAERTVKLEEQLAENTKRFEIKIAEHEAVIKTYKELLQDKNPEVINLLKDIKELNSNVLSFMKSMKDFLELFHKQNREEMQKQTAMLEMGRRRSDKMDSATATHKGDVVRMPKEEEVV